MLLVILGVMIIGLGYLHNMLFVNINKQLHHLYYLTKDSYIDAHMKDLIEGHSYNNLMWAKWIFTALFTISYLLLSCLILKLLFGDNGIIKSAIFLYSALILISAILYFGGALIGEPWGGYRLARFCMGILESPVPLMILIPAFGLSKSS